MPILNYTTEVPVAKTAAEIQARLARAKVQSVMTEYGADGQPAAISFRMTTPHGLLSFRLAAKVDGIHLALQKDRNIPRGLKTREQAARVAWRLLKDRIAIQLADVETGLAEMAEVFLAYVQDSKGQTLFDALRQDGFRVLSLPPPSKEGAK